jgi:hypothetical protein
MRNPVIEIIVPCAFKIFSFSLNWFDYDVLYLGKDFFFLSLAFLLFTEIYKSVSLYLLPELESY